VLLYRGVHPRRERPSVWVGQTVLAGMPANAPAAKVHPAIEADALADGDDHDPAAAPASAEGGHPHAPF
jgi:hypothetical protein